MKTNKLLLVFAMLLVASFAIQLASACNHNKFSDSDEGYYLENGDDVIYIVYNSDSEDYSDNYWDNDNRLPVSSYKNGYSYRATQEYRDTEYERNYLTSYSSEHASHEYYSYSNYERQYTHSYRFQESPEYYYTYDDYMRTYTAHECYTNAPSDKLIYVKCP